MTTYLITVPNGDSIITSQDDEDMLDALLQELFRPYELKRMTIEIVPNYEMIFHSALYNQVTTMRLHGNPKRFRYIEDKKHGMILMSTT